ncbi:MAG: hypothetical protein JW857_03435 [Bacteroidales bacterium]|nr:hypothetical protein [Bacteroidales bacterium]
MTVYKIKNFKVGDIVYHLRHTEFRMIVVRINNSRNEILCSWISADGKIMTIDMKPYELGKVSAINKKTVAYA